ncbi:hypothetical protein GCM10027605_12510 [Micromonospora zhanjiangensis]
MTATHHHHHTLAPSYTGTVVLDIGGDTGALVIHTGPELLGAEIEVSPVDRGVRRRVPIRRFVPAGWATPYCTAPSIPS